MFACDNKNCIPYWWKCDSVNDCGDNSDEIGCGQTKTTLVPGNSSSTTPVPSTTYPTWVHLCRQNEFQCATGECIREAWVCDGTRDCKGGEDESNCKGAQQCTSVEFKCRMDGSCIPVSSF